jgi:hypothetical protein
LGIVAGASMIAGLAANIQNRMFFFTLRVCHTMAFVHNYYHDHSSWLQRYSLYVMNLHESRLHF